MDYFTDVMVISLLSMEGQRALNLIKNILNYVPKMNEVINDRI